MDTFFFFAFLACYLMSSKEKIVSIAVCICILFAGVQISFLESATMSDSFIINCFCVFILSLCSIVRVLERRTAILLYVASFIQLASAMSNLYFDHFTSVDSQLIHETCYFIYQVFPFAVFTVNIALLFQVSRAIDFRNVRSFIFNFFGVFGFFNMLQKAISKKKGGQR